MALNSRFYMRLTPTNISQLDNIEHSYTYSVFILSLPAGPGNFLIRNGQSLKYKDSTVGCFMND